MNNYKTECFDEYNEYKNIFFYSNLLKDNIERRVNYKVECLISNIMLLPKFLSHKIYVCSLLRYLFIIMIYKDKDSF